RQDIVALAHRGSHCRLNTWLSPERFTADDLVEWIFADPLPDRREIGSYRSVQSQAAKAPRNTFLTNGVIIVASLRCRFETFMVLNRRIPQKHNQRFLPIAS